MDEIRIVIEVEGDELVYHLDGANAAKVTINNPDTVDDTLIGQMLREQNKKAKKAFEEGLSAMARACGVKKISFNDGHSIEPQID